MSWGVNLFGARFVPALSLGLLADVASIGSALNLPVGDVCSSQSLANFSRLLRVVVSTGSGAKRRLVLFVVSMGSGANFLRFDLDDVADVSIGSGANRRGFGASACSAWALFLEDVTVVSNGWGVKRRGFGASGSARCALSLEDVIVVSIGCGENLRGFGRSTSPARCLSLEDETVVSIGSTLNFLGGAAESMLRVFPVLDKGVVMLALPNQDLQLAL